MATNLEENITLQTAIYYNGIVENKYFNFFECIHEYDIDGIVEYFKENSISMFTISSNYSGLIDVLAKFSEAGYIPTGIVKIKSHIRDWHTHEYEEINAIHLETIGL